jgi:hypothetical protein
VNADEAVKWMRANGVEELELTYDRNQAQSSRVRRIRLCAYVAPAPVADPVLDDDPQANNLAMEALRSRMKAEARAKLQQEQDRVRFAASEGI